ncbi:hypothetical protein AAF712_010482 [Marasmius tenuissimus]|uniref:F-box domain-containing protein n=1 Tax=Marasmius tenuissimus TaxID=585030 RepID=A0ABR2ZN12_9AGAR
MLTKKIDRLEEGIRRLNEERKRLESFARTYKTVLNPVRCLPEVVLREIFLACISDLSGFMGIYWHSANKQSRVRNSLNPAKPPWTLGQVCSSWRTVALSHSLIWSFMSISFPRAESPQSVWNCRLSQLMLQIYRSSSQPLTVALQSHVSIDPYNPLLVSICSHAARWVNLRLRFDDTTFRDLQELISPILKGRIPNLRGLQWIVHKSDSSTRGRESTLLDAFEHAPSLVDLAIHPQHYKIYNLVRLPWSQMTSYSGIRLRLSTNYPYLLEMKNLRSLYLIDVNHLDGVPPITLPSLTTLSLASRPGSTTENVGPLLELLTLPDLQELRISVDHVIASLPDFVTRSAPTLRSFWFKLSAISDDAFIEMLEIIPVLTSLSIQHPTNILIRALARTSSKGTPRLLPQLCELRLFSGEAIDDMESFASLVALRADNGVPELGPPFKRGRENVRRLKRLCCDEQLSLGDDDVQELRASGLDVLPLTPQWGITPFP